MGNKAAGTGIDIGSGPGLTPGRGGLRAGQPDSAAASARRWRSRAGAVAVLGEHRLGGGVDPTRRLRTARDHLQRPDGGARWDGLGDDGAGRIGRANEQDPLRLAGRPAWVRPLCPAQNGRRRSRLPPAQRPAPRCRAASGCCASAPPAGRDAARSGGSNRWTEKVLAFGPRHRAICPAAGWLGWRCIRRGSTARRPVGRARRADRSWP